MYINVVSSLANAFSKSIDWKKKSSEILKKAKGEFSADCLAENRFFPNDYEFHIKNNTLKNFKLYAKKLYDDSFISRKILNRIHQLEPANCLLFFGNIGSGKSCLYKSININNVYKRVINVSIILDGIRNESENSRREKLNQLTRLLKGDFNLVPEIEDGYHVLIVVDSVESICDELDISLGDFIQGIELSTQHIHIKWLLISKDIACVMHSQHYIILGSYQFKNQLEDEINKYFQTDILNWYDLDRVNIREKVNHNIWINGVDLDEATYTEFYDINYLPPVVANFLIRDIQEGNRSNQDLDFFKFLVEHVIQSLKVAHNDYNLTSAAIRNIPFYKNDEHGQLKNLLNCDGTLVILDTQRYLSDITTLIKSNLLSSYFCLDGQVYKIHSNFVWAYFFALSVLKDKLNIQLFNDHLRSNSQLGSNIKLIYQYLSVNHSDVIDVERLIEAYGSLDGTLFLLSYSSVEYRRLFLRGVRLYLVEDLSVRASFIQRHVSDKSLLIYGLYKCIAYEFSENVNLSEDFLEDVVVYVAGVFKGNLTEQNSRFLLSTLEHFLYSLSCVSSVNRQKIVRHVILYFTEYLRVSDEEFNEFHKEFLFKLSRLIIRNVNFTISEFYFLLFDVGYKDYAWRGFYRFAPKFIDSAFNFFLADYSVVYQSVEDESSEMVYSVLSELMGKKVYCGINLKNDKLFKLRFYIRSSFHKAVGNRVRRTFFMMENDANALLIKVADEFNRYIAKTNDKIEKSNLREGLLYIFKHVDISTGKERAQLPEVMKDIVSRIFDESLIKSNFYFVNSDCWRERIDELNKIFVDSY